MRAVTVVLVAAILCLMPATSVQAQVLSATGTVTVHAVVLPRPVVPELGGPPPQPRSPGAITAPATPVSFGATHAGPQATISSADHGTPDGTAPVLTEDVPSGRTPGPDGTPDARTAPRLLGFPMTIVRQTPTRAHVALTLPFREGAGYGLSVRAPNGGERVSPEGIPWALQIETTPGHFTAVGPAPVALQVLPTGPVHTTLRFRIDTTTPERLTDILESLELPVLIVLLAPVSL